VNATRRQIEMPESWQDELAPGQHEKPRFPAAVGMQVARDLIPLVAPLCQLDRLKVCGSLRRRKKDIGDLEIVFVPQWEVTRAEERDILGTILQPAVYAPRTAALLDELVRRGVLTKREKRNGTLTGWGLWNRFAVHVASGLPVDFFGCAAWAWWNIVVSRTGASRSNLQICNGAMARGWHWEPGPEDPGFQKREGLGVLRHAVHSEREVFEFAGVPYREPWERS